MNHRTTDSATRESHLFAWLAASLALAVILFPQAAHAQYSYSCGTAGTWMGDLYNYRNCAIDFDGDPGYERVAKFFENVGSESDPPHEVAGDRHCYQGKTFEGGSAPDADDFNYIHFSLLLPENDTSDFPVLVVLRGGSIGWSDTGAAPQDHNSWRLDTDAVPLDWETGEYLGLQDLSNGIKDEEVLLSFLTDDDGNIVDKLRQEFPGWAILVPSGCSHDLWNGRPSLEDDDPEFENAARTRYGYVAIVEALDWVDSQYGIEYLYVVGGSGGGAGGFILAADLLDDLADPNILLRGVVSEAGPLETPERAALFDESDTRGVDADGNCADTEAVVSCRATAEPFATADVETGLDRNISDEIQTAAVTVPILHMFNPRDFTHCYDPCYSDDHLHGAIAAEIAARKVGSFDEDFDASESVEMCVGECVDGNQVLLQCTGHTVLGWRDNAPVNKAVNCAVNWIKEVNDYFDGNITQTTRPTACDNITAGLGGQNPATCGEQSENSYY